jgi:hypothetical protein
VVVSTVLPLKIEITPDRAEFSEEPNKVLQRAHKPVNRPRRDNVILWVVAAFSTRWKPGRFSPPLAP